MATQCTASAKMALPVLLRSVFRSEFPRNLHATSAHRLTRPQRTFQQPRLYSSTPRFCQLVLDQSSPQSTESSSLQTTEDIASSASQKSTPPSAKSQVKTKRDGKKATKESKSTGKDAKFDKPKKLPINKKNTEHWQIQKGALGEKFPAGWNPPKKLSPDALDGIRHLHATAPDRFTTSVLAEEFKTSPEAIRRILKSKWRPSGEEVESRRKRWEKRHERIWSQMSELGLRPSTKASRPVGDASRLLYGDDDNK
ncbi:hypothetical protein N7448_001709 [Penicillium atrosanguineum]|uniref:Required for respiratory growth protein 9, mitochondrial n=1 Tax=Penicillium atrosanguineum TaxID=1132637 RepID=A0A9W9HK62_9EURO|nr:beta-lactamase/transpeptidase-like protein [Penicillium atrosanguineum]KAJ5133261.1 hypothetical protein N7526_004626 [Penicillium atrosanguineum]KAJ5150131.1 hypothetical protein N7448_001709 [Penicillium atrosanguineum]KAJ5305445.1 beta-lactamase/transpeptidase-like protein [Penicillium atrosanguineum]KAJ5324907.1 hypothetical protein N7476_003507 [Penicillium atrosanguineum]